MDDVPFCDIALIIHGSTILRTLLIVSSIMLLSLGMILGNTAPVRSLNF